jgi:hypothetical protein
VLPSLRLLLLRLSTAISYSLVVVSIADGLAIAIGSCDAFGYSPAMTMHCTGLCSLRYSQRPGGFRKSSSQFHAKSSLNRDDYLFRSCCLRLCWLHRCLVDASTDRLLRSPTLSHSLVGACDRLWESPHLVCFIRGISGPTRPVLVPALSVIACHAKSGLNRDGYRLLVSVSYCAPVLSASRLLPSDSSPVLVRPLPLLLLWESSIQ